MQRLPFIFALLFTLSLLIFACNEEPQDDAVTPEPEEPQAPANLSYSPSSLTGVEGTPLQSSTPTVEGTPSFTFSLLNAPTEVSIASTTGVISTTASLPAGEYSLSVKVVNDVGEAIFNEALRITLEAQAPPSEAPRDLIYLPNTVTLAEGERFTSEAPSLSGTSPFTFSLVNSPDPAFSIDANTGVISVGTSLVAGVYALNVKVENEVGENTFNNALEVSVVGEIITFTGHVRPLLVSKCAPCHTSGAQAQGGMDWEVYNDTERRFDDILRTSQNGSMPPGSNDLTQEEIDLLIAWRDAGFPE